MIRDRVIIIVGGIIIIKFSFNNDVLMNLINIFERWLNTAK